MKVFIFSGSLIISLLSSFYPAKQIFTTHHSPLAADTLHYPEETHFKNVQQLTFGGDNAEAYWSFDGKSVVFQRTSVKDGIPCDQIFYGSLPKAGEKFDYKLISTGKGRTTCA
ncbi:MAG TPA: hypothetical protein VGB71_01295, partial [Flavisolibacter sp.]